MQEQVIEDNKITEATQLALEETATTSIIRQLVATGDVDLCESRADAFYEEKSYENALLHYQASIELNQNNALLFNKRGMTYFYLKNNEKALLDYTQAIQLKKRPEFFNNRALVLHHLGRHEEALKDLMQAIELDPWNMGIVKNAILLRLQEKVNVPYF
jgi:tetratricopeptide (TPR) repeat protein